MDERHWWIAGKIQESFKFGNFENLSLLEDFMCEESTLTKVNKFLKAGGPCRLFFYCEKSNSNASITREIHCTGTLATLKEVDLERITILYFLRNMMDNDVDPNKMEKDIFCGELKHNAIETLNSLLADIYIPLIRAQKNWGHCNEEGQTTLMLNMDKFVTALNETASSVSHLRQMMLRQPENATLNDFKIQRAATLEPQLVNQYEELVNEWISTTETVLNDTSDERFLDPNAGPLSELERWRRRQRLLTNITEQLKGKECKHVLAVLITAKSRILKKWKNTDACITDSLNDTKDKVKYLESLKRHFDPMYQDASPASIIATALPGLVNTIKQMDSVSRFYARTGFLGILLAKVTNQLVQVCKDHISRCTYNVLEDNDELWDRVVEEVISCDSAEVDSRHRAFNKQGENKLRGSRTKVNDAKDSLVPEDIFYTRLQSCLSLQSFYKEYLHSLKDALGASHNLSHFSSLSSFSTINNPLKRGTIGPGLKSNQLPPPNRGFDASGHGVPITDEDALLSHFDVFCGRIHQMLEVINTMKQFNKLSKGLAGVPRPRKEDLITDDILEPDYKQRKPKDLLIDLLDRDEEEAENAFGSPAVQISAPCDHTLHVISENEEQQAAQDGGRVEHSTAARARKEWHYQEESSVDRAKGLAQEDLVILRKYYPEEEDVEGPSVSSVVEQHLAKMTQAMKYVTTKTMLDVESKDKDKFNLTYQSFQSIIQDLEKFLGAYLNVTFMRKMKTQQGLDIITKFNPIVSRSGMQRIIAEKYVEIFGWYEMDLKEVQKIYEKHKEHPILTRNAPPAAGAIYWSRQLLKRIEDPMKIFRDIKAVTSLADFARQVRIYNRLATALVTFESLWFIQWKNNIEKASSGLRATLFVHHPHTGEIAVNADERILELIHEAKWMTRLDIQIPETAMLVMQQEGRFKSYKSHLELVLRDFKEVCQSIASPLVKLFNPHIEHVYQQLQPGLSTLAWNSMNIDAFLHQIHTAIDQLKTMYDDVSTVMRDKVSNVISTMKNFCLFDTEMAFSRTWPVGEFCTKMMNDIDKRTVLLQNYVETVLKALQSVAIMLAPKKSGSKQSVKETIQLPLAKQLVAFDEANVTELIAHFKDQVFQAVFSATTKSLACLAEAVGCTGEVIRAFTPSPVHEMQSECSSPSPRGACSNCFGGNGGNSRISSAQSARSHSQASERPTSNITILSELTWSPGNHTIVSTPLKFEVSVKFSVPNIIVEPDLDVVQKAITDTANAILEASREITWMNVSDHKSFHEMISDDPNVKELYSQLKSVVHDFSSLVSKHLHHFSYYNFLWRDDMQSNFREFVMSDPGISAIKREVERYLSLEKKVQSIPGRLPVGPVNLFSDPVKDSLHGFTLAWKSKFASVIHEEAKKKLDNVVSYRSSVKTRLEQQVQTLDQLNSALHLLEELQDLENKIDSMYLPIETMYAYLREFELRLPRNEVKEVESLREKWVELIKVAEEVREVLLKERKGAFEQELDKQVKTFMVEAIQFRNAFDAQGPAVPGIQPIEAVSRLHDFQQRYTVYDSKRNTLDSVSKLFGILCKPFSELDKTGEELDLLSQLYGLFQKFIHFDSKFRDTLWAEVDLEVASVEVEGLWDECLALPSKLKDWNAYSDLKNKLQTYLEIFPLLQKLASQEIRNRHWLEVMQVSHSSFPLEGNVFRLCHLLDIGLIKHKAEVEEICQGANRELELEIKMRLTEEEWTEQVLNFNHYKKRGPMFLDKAFTERLLEQLEDAEALLATMLTSRYIGPLRDEAASWAEKLKEVAEVLELWLEVQDLWQYLEAVFSYSKATRELPQEATRFARIDKGWTKMMKRAFDTRNVLQCCYGGEVPKAVVLHHIREELEICFKSLVGYLDNKRRAFPRFYFVSDPILLALLSRPNDLESVRPRLRSLFSAVADIKFQKACEPEDSENDSDPNGAPYNQGMASTLGVTRSPREEAQHHSLSSLSAFTHSTTPPKIDKRLHQHFSISVLQQGMTMLPSEGLVSDALVMDATAVLSVDGEILTLSEKVTLTDEVEVWLEKLRVSIGETLQQLNQQVMEDCRNSVGLEDWALKYPSQVCRTGMLYHWTAECEAAIVEIKSDRKALQGALRKYSVATGKLVTLLLRGSWRTSDEPMLPVHHLRLEAMIMQSSFLKDILENMCQRKLKETTDFEWRRSVRCYMQPDPTLVQQMPDSAGADRSHTASTEPNEEGTVKATGAGGKPNPRIWILDSHYPYGHEFYGTDAGVSATPVTEKCFLAMSLALKQVMGSLLLGPPGVGKRETVKGLGNLLGNYVGIFQVSKEHDAASIGKIAQGLAMDGCWGCFDEAQSLNQAALSILLEHVQSIFQAVRARRAYMYLVDGTDIPLRKTVGLFMCMNISSFPSTQLSAGITESFRAISLVKPDISMILKARCVSMGFRSPAVLSNRLKILTELVKDQLPSETHHHFTVPALIGVLRRASQKRQKEREDKMADRNAKDEASRSESQSSELAVSRPVLPTLNFIINKPGQVSGLRKPGTSNPLTAQGKQEHSMVCETIDEIIGPRLTTENYILFKSILKDCFSNLPSGDVQGGKSFTKGHNMLSAKLRNVSAKVSIDMEAILQSIALESGLVSHKPWINKCLQLYTLSKVYNGVIVAGPPGCGKSTCIQTLVDALSAQGQVITGQSISGSKAPVTSEGTHKLLHINPMVVDDTSLMFGSLGHNKDWVDGILTQAMRKANRNISSSWICLDGTLNQSWADNFNSILAGDKVLHLKNGDKLFLSENIRLLFETDNLNQASPTTVSCCGILYIDRDVVGWKPIVKVWLDTRSQLEVHVLQKVFQKTLDPIINFVTNEAKPCLQLCEVSMLKACLGLLGAMLTDNIEVSGELHIERLYLFCLIWTFGGLLDASDRKAFNDLLTNLSTALPDDDRDICVFDYYVDESGEWDPWHSRVPEAVYAGKQDLLGEVFVDTVDTVQTRLLMEFSAAAGRNILLVGPHGSGKTAIINDFIKNLDPQVSVCKRLVFSGASTALQLQQFIDANITHRQGFVYGAKDNKKLKVFIDDLNLPLPDENGTQRCNELLRQLLDERQLCTLQKPFEWQTVEDLSVLSAMTFGDYPAAQSRPINGRLLRHFAVFSLPPPKNDALKSIVNGVLEANLTANNTTGLDPDLHKTLVSASCDMLTVIQNVLRPTPMEGRHHYLFTLKDITRCFQCLKRLADESKADEAMVISLWKHELTRIVKDRMSRSSDVNWFENKLDSVTKAMKNTELKLYDNFVTFPLDVRALQRPVTSTKQIKVSLQPVQSMDDLHNCLATHLTRYNEEFGNIRLNIMLSNFIISHIVRIHRILSYHHSGNLLLVGAIGIHLTSLCRLALHVAGIPIHKIDTSKQSTFFDGLRSAIRLCGSEGKVISIMLTSCDLQDLSYLDAINCLLISGEYPPLFSSDELEGFLQALQPAMKRELPSMPVFDPMRFFVSRVKSNLHFLICLQPDHELLRTATINFPGLLIGCQMNWLCDWPQEALLGEASYFVTKHQISEDFEDLRENIIASLSNIHSFVLRDCKQLPWTGDVSAEITMTTVKVLDKKKEQLKIESATVPNFPYSKVILQERIKEKHRDRGMKAKNEVYIGPATYRRFLECFRYLYFSKTRERTRAIEQLKRAISTLDETRTDVKVMKKGIKAMTGKFEEAKNKTAELLKKLTTRATALEKLKAKVGLSKSLDAYLHLSEMYVEEEEEDDDLLKAEEYDEYDAEFDRMRKANLKTRQVQAKEELAEAVSRVDQCRANLAYAREQVIFWRNKVDRGVIERVRAFFNPPLLVGQVIEMVMVLIGKRLPSQRIAEIKETVTGKEEQSSKMSSSSGSTKLIIKKAKIKETGDRFDKAQWKGMAQTMTDSNKFVDMLHNVPWEDGLPSDVLAAVESYLACSKDGQLGVTGEGSLLENAEDKQFLAVKQRSPSPGARGGLTIAGAKYASEDCATLVHYTIAIVEFTRLCGPLKSAMDRLHELEREIEENKRLQKQQEEESIKEEEPSQEQEEEDLSEADLPRLQKEVDELQALFDKAVMEKHSLQVELQSMNEHLRVAVEMADSLKPQELRWRQDVKDNNSNKLFIANCVVASATLTYCAPVNIDTRRRMGEFFMQVCEHHGLPLHKKQLFRNIELIDFLYTTLDVTQLQRLQLPTTQLMLENACFLMQDTSMTAWPLICDPTSRVIDWLRNFHSGKELIEVKYCEIRSQLENCLSEGAPLLVTDCDLKLLMMDKRFTAIIQNCVSFVNGKSRFKVVVTDHEVECDPDFRLFLHTTSEPHLCPPQLAAYTAVTYFQQSRAGMEEELLDVFTAQEKSRLESEQLSLRQEKEENLQMMERLEQQMRDLLSNDIRLIQDLQTTKKLVELKKHYDEAIDSQARVQASEDSITRAKESFRVVAQRAAVCFDTAQYMREVNSLYQSSWKQFVSLYQAAIAHSERSSLKAVVDRLTFSAFTTFARGLLERDRFIYTLLLAVEVEDSRGNVGLGEREFVISPNFSSVIMSAIAANATVDSHILQSKKPFDWMTEDQFHNLQVLASHFEWFKDMFDRMPRDGRETQWRNLCESDMPENVPLPDKMDDVFKPLQRLCIVRAVRNDRLLPAASCFINNILGKKYTADVSLDLPTVLRQSTPSLPIMLLYHTEAEMTVRIFQEFADKRQTRFITVMLTDNNVSDEKAIKKQIVKGMADGTWILLHNAHNNPNLLSGLESNLQEGLEQPNSNFRLWVSAHVQSTCIPVRLIQKSVRVFLDSPKFMKDSLIRNLSWMDPDILKQPNRSEWPSMLHNLCFLHAAIQLRARFGLGGWNLPHEFKSIGFRELREAVNFTAGEFRDPLFVVAADGSLVPRTTSWTGIRYVLSEVVYGTYITDAYDQQTLNAMVDYWCTPTAVKKDFEVARLKYKTPGVFFSPGARMNTLIQAMDGLGQHTLEVPEACHLHPNIETLLGDDQYIFTRLNKVFDAMPASTNLSHQLFPRPPTPFSGPPVANISSQSNNPLVVDQGVFSSASCASYKMQKDVELWEICYTMLQKVPKTYTKNYILEKVKKVGGLTTFNSFILKELDLMYRIVYEIKRNLQTIKSATESNILGDQLSHHALYVADDIYHLRIPEIWCRMSGNSAPPLTFGLGQWLVELQNRCHHFEKILTLYANYVTRTPPRPHKLHQPDVLQTFKNGHEKMPAYWLGAFFNPRGLLAMLKQDSIRNYANDRSGNFELLTFQTEITSRDKDHLRDPPQEGMFIWGIHLWGCSWDKTTGELHDTPPRTSCSALPVVHITCWPMEDKPDAQDSTKTSETYQCPVYHSRLARKDVVLELDVRREGIPAARWALRGLAATIRSY